MNFRRVLRPVRKILTATVVAGIAAACMVSSGSSTSAVHDHRSEVTSATKEWKAPTRRDVVLATKEWKSTTFASGRATKEW